MLTHALRVQVISYLVLGGEANERIKTELYAHKPNTILRTGTLSFAGDLSIITSNVLDAAKDMIPATIGTAISDISWPLENILWLRIITKVLNDEKRSPLDCSSN